MQMKAKHHWLKRLFPPGAPSLKSDLKSGQCNIQGQMGSSPFCHCVCIIFHCGNLFLLCFLPHKVHLTALSKCFSSCVLLVKLCLHHMLFFFLMHCECGCQQHIMWSMLHAVQPLENPQPSHNFLTS